MPGTGNVTVGKGFTNQIDTYDLAGSGPSTVGQALAKFKAGNGGGDIPLANVRVNNRVAESLDQTLNDGDFILIQDSAVRAGGLKGA